MKRIKVGLFVVLWATLACVAKESQAAVVFVDPSAFTGFRTTSAGGGLAGNGAWAGEDSPGVPELRLDWNIVYDSISQLYTYTYSLTRADSSAGISHWIVELTHYNLAGGNLETYWNSVFGDPNVGTWGAQGNSNPGIGGGFVRRKSRFPDV